MLHGDIQPAELNLKTVHLQDLTTCKFMIRSDRSSSDLFTTQYSTCVIILYILVDNVKINVK